MSTSSNSRLLVVDDDHSFRSVLSREMTHRGFQVTPLPSGSAALAWLQENECDLLLLDLRLPDMNGMTVLKTVRERHPRIEVVLLTGHGTIDTAIEAIRMGAFHYLTKPCSPDEIEVTLQKARERSELVERTTILEDGLALPDLGESFVGASAKYNELVRLIDRIAATDSAVLILGETGVGKELVAKRIHNRSARRDGPFVVVDCGTLHENLLESELFGHEKGAYTGAARLKHGLFEVAHGGTVFLDEIGDVAPTLQVKLLRVLETGGFRRLGSTVDIRVDARVVAATNRDLAEAVEAGLFRQDLFYRLNTIRIDVPPLRERVEDIPCLALHYVRRYNQRFNKQKQLSPDALAALSAQRWPGNVRQLIHVVEQAIVLSDEDVLGPEHFPARLRTPTAPQLKLQESKVVPLAEVERQYVEFVVKEMGGHRAMAAKALGISERSLYRKLKEYDIE